MPFISGVDFLTLSRRIEETCFRPLPLIAAPELQSLPSNGGSNFKFYLCSKEHCIKFVDLFTSTSLMEVLQVDDENVRKDLSQILNGNTDLIPNQYEGGFKVWEGLYDLIEYIDKNGVIEKTVGGLTEGQKEVNILDLGCGSGLLSIYIAHQFRCKFPSIRFRVYLQDYNENVIKYFSIPNVLLNDVIHSLRTQPEEDLKEQLAKLVATVRSSYEFLYGDWGQVSKELSERGMKFDLILSAETLYSEANYEKLYDTFHSLLRHPLGEVLIATKSHYFGVGGGTWSFVEYVDNKKNQPPKELNKSVKKQKVSQATLNVKLVHEIEANLLRHIIILEWI